MKSLNNKKLIIILCLILSFTILFNIGGKAYASFVLSGIAIKVFSTLLASMGILAFANSQSGGINAFWEGFKDYTEGVKGIQDVISIFAEQGIRTFTGKVKMSVSSLVNMIKDYYMTFKPLPAIADLPTLQGTYIDRSTLWNDSLLTPWRLFNITEVFDLGSGYTLTVYLSRYSGSIGKARYSYITKYNGVTVNSNTRSNVSAIGNDNYVGENSKAKVLSRISINDTNILIAIGVMDITGNKQFTESISLEFPELVGHQPLEELPTAEDFPLPLTVPNTIPFPWAIELEKLGSISGSIGKTLEELIQSINDLPIQSYIDSLLDLPKTIIDSYPIPTIVTTPEGVITDVNVPPVDVTYPEIVKQTGILGAIALGIEGIKDIIEDLVKPVEIEELDFSPLQNISVTDRFPFSLPWDLKNSISLLVAPPVAPVFNVPMVTEEIIIDLNEFETLAKISRSMLSIIFVVGLIITTRRFVGGA